MDREEWIVITRTGKFLGMYGELRSEYPDACLFADYGNARDAARDSGQGLGPYQIMTTDEYRSA